MKTRSFDITKLQQYKRRAQLKGLMLFLVGLVIWVGTTALIMSISGIPMHYSALYGLFCVSPLAYFN